MCKEMVCFIVIFRRKLFLLLFWLFKIYVCFLIFRMMGNMFYCFKLFKFIIIYYSKSDNIDIYLVLYKLEDDNGILL